MTINHDEEVRQYSLEVDMGEAYVDYRDVGGVRDLHYSYVSPELRGRGIGRELVSETFESIMAERLPARISCGYVASVARTRSEWAEYFLESVS